MFMQKLVFPVIMISLVLSACGQKDLSPKGEINFIENASATEPLVYVSSDSYERTEVETLNQNSDCDEYTSGALEYRENGVWAARVEFLNDPVQEGQHRIRCHDRQGQREVSSRSSGGKESKYEKVIIEPLVKIEGCDYLVEGKICYYEGTNWVATIDFGDGSCDEWATKTTKDGADQFSLKKWNKKI